MKYNEVMMETAVIWSNMSYCKRAKVGAVISNQNRIISTGYNGTISGAENCCENVIDGNIVEESIRVYGEKEINRFKQAWRGGNINEIALDILTTNYKHKEYKEIEITGVVPCSNGDIVLDYEIKFKHREFELVSKNTVVHAEANALMFATKNGIKTDGCTLYVTLSPCVECSKMMIQAGIKEVFYKTEYRIADGIEFLKENGIKVTKI